MGKGYNNYMCKKPFHPGSKANIKRAWMAEQKTENEKKKQEELKVQYEKEQDLYNNRALLSTEGKEKLELNFMYEAPPGAKRERQKEDDEPEYKFEWQRKYNAPREDYAKGNADIKDQPFGIPVRNVRCIKCHKWGHINTDKECPLYSQASTSSMPTTSMDPIELMRQMKEDGFGLKENVLGHHLNPKAANQQLIPSDESDPEMEFLKSLSTAEKKKLLRKLKKLSKKQEKASRSKKKKNKKTKKSKCKDSSDSGDDVKRKKKKSKDSDESGTDSSSDDSCPKEKKLHTKVNSSSSKAKKHSRTKTPSDSESEDNASKKKKHSKLLKHQDKLSKNSKGIKQEYHTSPLPTQNQEHSRWINKNASVIKEENDDQTKQSLRNTKKSKDVGVCKTSDAEIKSKHSSKTSKSIDSEKRSKYSISPEKKSNHSKSPVNKWKHSESPESKSKHSNSSVRKSKRSDSLDRKSKNSASPERKSKNSASPERKSKNSNSPERKSKPSKSPQAREEISESNKEAEVHANSQKNSHSDREEVKGECKSVKRKANLDVTEQSDTKKKKSDASDSETDNKEHEDHPQHPDGFSHLRPQAKIDANYLQADEEYQGKVHDRFRLVNRDRRSPSVKQKYNK